MKIAIYSHSILPTVDGVARRFAQIIEELVSQGHEVFLFTLEDRPEGLPSSVRYQTLKSTGIPNYPGKLLGVPTIVNLYFICSSLHQERPDIIHCVSDALSNSFGLIGKSMRIPVVTSIHTDIQTLGRKIKAPRFGRKMANFKEQMDSRLLDGCATTSKSFANQLSKQGIMCDHSILTSVDVKTFSPTCKSRDVRNRLTFGNPDKFLAVFVGRLAAEKRLEILLRIVETIPDIFIAFIGDGPVASKLAKFHGPENRIFCEPAFLSHSEIAAIYASADIHLSASMFETLGNTVLEAHACGIPVIVPRCQGFVDTVSHGEDGFLFESADTLSEDEILAEASGYLRNLMNDKELCANMGKNGRSKVMRNCKKQVVEDLLLWYKRSRDRWSALHPVQISLQCLQLVFLVILSVFFCHLCENIFPFLLFSKNNYLALKRCARRRIERIRGIQHREAKFSICDD